ncbi:MAG: hypothetical protein IJ111_03750, partial [Eggerthellaceae bacterium]|nr:hypothetical protein [Eggerthellaceae bacterium]
SSGLQRPSRITMLVVATPAMASSLRSSEHLFQSYRWKEGRPVFSRAHPFCTAEREALDGTKSLLDTLRSEFGNS